LILNFGTPGLEFELIPSPKSDCILYAPSPIARCDLNLGPPPLRYDVCHMTIIPEDIVESAWREIGSLPENQA